MYGRHPSGHLELEVGDFVVMRRLVDSEAWDDTHAFGTKGVKWKCDVITIVRKDLNSLPTIRNSLKKQKPCTEEYYNIYSYGRMGALILPLFVAKGLIVAIYLHVLGDSWSDEWLAFYHCFGVCLKLQQKPGGGL